MKIKDNNYKHKNRKYTEQMKGTHIMMLNN